jgi:hypothetical protein
MAKKAAAHRTRKPSAAWQGQLTFGMITFPVRALTGAREDKISFNQICPTHRCRTQALEKATAPISAPPFAEAIEAICA